MKVTRLKTGGFLTSGSDAGDLEILRKSNDYDDGSGMKAGGPVKSKLKKVITGLKKASKLHAGQAKTLGTIKMKEGGNTKKVGPPSKKKLTDKARNIIRKDKSENKMSSFIKVADMLTKQGFTGAAGEKRKVHATDRRKKLNREIFKGGEAKQTPAFMKEGGKAKSKVNEAGNYTKPGMRKQIFNRIKAGGKGGRPGQWSARKAQMMAKSYKKAGGGYK